MTKHFKLHNYIKKNQEKAFEELKKSSSDEHIALQIDFAESYSVTSQNETQSAHFSKPTITVFTAVAYSSEKVFHFIKVIVNEIKKVFPNVERLLIV